MADAEDELRPNSKPPSHSTNPRVMASYTETPLKEEQYHHHPQHLVPQYPPPPDVTSPGNATFNDQLYPNTDPALQPALQPVALQPAPLPQHQVSTSKVHKSPGQGEGSEPKDVKNRLRKACDSCSIRKVKCDENSPCRACVALDIPCTFDRPSKRRGPPNRHADAIKKQRTGSPVVAGQSQPGSPTHAAHTLASFSQQQVLSADTIMPWPVLSALVDDYFTFVHPLIPVPHEPSFRQALQRREDLTNRTFLALFASMLGCLAASFPRRPRQHLRTLGFEGYFPNSISIVERCRKVAIEAQGPATFQRKHTVHDAIISYLQGLTSAYTFDQDSCLLYYSQCLAICTTLGLYKSSTGRNTADGSHTPRMTPNGQGLQGPQIHGETDPVLQELGRRTFWMLYTSVKSLQQLSTFSSTLDIAPATKTYPYPPLPLEIDDQYLTPQQVYPQPSETISQLAGFNINARVFSSYEKVSTNELVHGVNEVFDWERQKAELEESLQNIKQIIEELPAELQINHLNSLPSPTDPKYPSLQDQTSLPLYQPSKNFPQDGINDRSTIQHEIQKANIYANQLSIRSHLVEKYWTLRTRHQTISATTSIPSEQPTLASTSSSALTEAAMNAERRDLIQDFLRLFSSLGQVAIEPSGTSLILKLHAIASTLLRTAAKSPSDRDANGRRRTKPAISEDDGGSVHPGAQEEDLELIFASLVRLEGWVPANGNPAELDEEAQLRGWAEYRGVQERVIAGGEDNTGQEGKISTG